MKLICLFDQDAKPVLVNPEFIEGVTMNDDGTATVHLNSGNSVPTNASMNEIREKLAHD